MHTYPGVYNTAGLHCRSITRVDMNCHATRLRNTSLNFEIRESLAEISAIGKQQHYTISKHWVDRMKPTNWNMAKDVTKDILLYLRARGFLNLYLSKKESFPQKQQDIHNKKTLYVGKESDHCSRKELCCICWFLWYYFFHVFLSFSADTVI